MINSKRIVALVMVAAVTCLLSPGVAVAAAGCTVSVIAPEDVNAGSSDVAELWLHSDTPVVGFELFVNCDSAVVEIEKITPGDVGSFSISTQLKEDGSAYVTGYLTSLNPITDGRLAVIQFKAVGAVGTTGTIAASGDVYSWRTIGSGTPEDPQSYEPVLLTSEFENATVNVTIIHSLTLAVNPGGTGTTTPEAGVHQYKDGSVVEVSAIPAEGYEFSNWVGDVANPSGQITTTNMNGSKTLIARFVPVTVPGGGDEEPEPEPIVDTNPPIIFDVRAIDISKTSAEIFWVTDEIADSQVEFGTGSSQKSDLDTNLKTAHSVKLTGLAPLTEYTFKVFSTDIVGLTGVSEEMSFTTAGQEALFTTGEWRIDNDNAVLNGVITITFSVTNSGDKPGVYDVNFLANGAQTENRQLMMAAGETQRIEFSYQIPEYGNYVFRVGETSLFVEVPEPARTPPYAWWGLGGGGALLALLVWLLIFYRRDWRGVSARWEENEIQEQSTAPAVPSRESNPAVEPEFPPAAQPSNEFHIDIGKAGFSIEPAALVRLTEAATDVGRVQSQLLRISPGSPNTKILAMSVDFFRPGDAKIEYAGRTVLLIDPDALPSLDGSSIGYQDGDDGGNFYVSRKP